MDDEIDMDRIVADPDYRRSVISRLKRERLSKAVAAADDPDAAPDED